MSRNILLLVSMLILSILMTGCTVDSDAIIQFLEELAESPSSSETISSSVGEEASEATEINTIAPITEPFTVVRVVDGDTIWVEDDRGEQFKIRIIGVDAPETAKQDQEGELFAYEAFEFAKQVLSNRIVYLERDVSDTDQYDRLLRYVWVEKPDDGSANTFEQLNFSALLVRGGYACVVAYGNDTRYESELRALEKLAKADRLGIWAHS